MTCYHGSTPSLSPASFPVADENVLLRLILWEASFTPHRSPADSHVCAPLQTPTGIHYTYCSCCFPPSVHIFFLSSLGNIFFIAFRVRRRERNTDGREKHQSVASCAFPTGYRTCNLGTCPDLGSNLQPFGLWDDAPTN